MLYTVLKSIVALGIRNYYREIKVVNEQYLQQEGPCIIIANHPNTLMDAWIVGYANKRRVFFMAKATFFNTPLKRKLLNSLGMIPVNRKADGAVKGVNNKDSFAACYQLLEKGEILVIFPEGTSYMERRLREIKTGTARIALEVEKRNQGKLGLKVIPIGLNYIEGSSYRGRVLVQVGRPIPVSDLWQQYEEKPAEAAKILTERFRVELSRVFVNMDDSSREDLVEELDQLFVTRYSKADDVKDKVAFMKTVQERLEAFSVTAPWKVEEVQRESNRIQEQLAQFGIKADFLDRRYRRSLFIRQYVQSFVFLLITIPLFLIGFIHHVIPYYLIGVLVPKISKDVEYHAPLAILLGLILYPLNYLVFWIIASSFLGFPWWLCLVYVSVLPLLGTFAHFFMRYMKHNASKWRFHRFARSRSEVLEKLRADREHLKSLIFRD